MYVIVFQINATIEESLKFVSSLASDKCYAFRRESKWRRAILAQDKHLFSPTLHLPSRACLSFSAMADADPMSRALSSIIERAHAPEEFKKWCIKKKLVAPMDIALLACDEKEVRGSLLEACKPEVPSIVEPHVDVSVRKVWIFARDAMKKKDTVGQEDAELDITESQDLDTAWFGMYKVRLTTRERVSRKMMRRLYDMVNSEPPEFEVIWLEQIILYAENAKQIQQVVKQANNSLTVQGQNVLSVTTADMAWEKIKALLLSFAYVSTGRSGWCSYDVARTTIDELWVRVQEAARHSAPMSFYNDAWVATSQVWQTHVVVSRGTLSEAMERTSSWSQFWSYRCPGCPVCSPKGRGKSNFQLAGQSLDGTTRSSRRGMQELLYKTMSRFQRNTGGGYAGGKKGGKKGSWSRPVMQPQWNKNSKGFGKDGGKGAKGKNKGSKGGWKNGARGGNGQRW